MVDLRGEDASVAYQKFIFPQRNGGLFPQLLQHWEAALERMKLYENSHQNSVRGSLDLWLCRFGRCSNGHGSDWVDQQPKSNAQYAGAGPCSKKLREPDRG